jgi:chromosome segregation ATPase
MKATEDELSVKTLGLHETERSLSDKQAEMTRLSSDLGDRTATTEAQRVELISLKTQIEALKIRIGDYERDIKKTEDRLDKEREEASAATLNLNEERGKVQNLGKRVAELEQHLQAQTTEAEALGKRVAELDDRVADQGRLLAERDYECDRLRTEVENARRTGFHLREELNSASAQNRELIQNLTAEKEVLQKEFDRANSERTKLQSELAAMKREAESSWAAERVENALLRERINDVAAEVAKLAVTLEGPNSPIEAILAKAPSPAPAALKVANGPVLVTTDDTTEKGSLADRMRALQNRASRLTTSS